MAKKILVIDDEELIVNALSKLLEQNGYAVLVAKNGQDAFEIIEEEDFDLLIVDIRMPGPNGVKTARGIYDRLEKRGVKQLPTIFITGYADEEIEQEAKSLKPIAYIHKPFNIPGIINKIKEALK